MPAIFDGTACGSLVICTCNLIVSTPSKLLNGNLIKFTHDACFQSKLVCVPTEVSCYSNDCRVVRETRACHQGRENRVTNLDCANGNRLMRTVRVAKQRTKQSFPFSDATKAIRFNHPSKKIIVNKNTSEHTEGPNPAFTWRSERDTSCEK